MDEAKRKRILDNISKLVELTDFLEVLKLCNEKKILSDSMIQNIENLDMDKIEKHKILLEKITHRKPDDFFKFADICQELNYIEAHEILIPASQLQIDGGIQSIRSNQEERFLLKNNTNTELKLFTDYVYHQLTTTIQKTTTCHSHNRLETYKMISKNRGILFLVNIIDFKNTSIRRNGAEIDSGSLIKLFREFGFKIYYYTNLSSEQFVILVDKLIQSNELAETECLVFALLTHGHESNSALFSNDGLLHVEDILHKFNNVNCPFLKGKPKIFLFPFCRGNSPDKGVYLRIQRKTEHDGTVKLPPPEICTDMLICYGTVPGYQTHREPLSGSWYIEAFCNVFAEYAHKLHVEDMLKIVHTNVMRKRTEDDKKKKTGEPVLNSTLQTPSNVNREFNKILFLNPGYIE